MSGSLHPRKRRSRGSVMAEFVMILPLLAVVLAITWYMGRMVVQAQHASFLQRYEAWRHVPDAPGPRPNLPEEQHPLLNETFFAGDATELDVRVNDGYFPNDPYDTMMEGSADVSQVAGELAEAVVYRNQSDEHRYSRGRRVSFWARHDSGVEDWDGVSRVTGSENPGEIRLVRRHIRLGTDWPYTNQWRSSADEYRASGGDPHYLRALRDAFYLDYDQNLDAIDGEEPHEYGSSGPQRPGRVLAGEIRRLYLRAPGYRGPIVWGEGREVGEDEDPDGLDP